MYSAACFTSAPSWLLLEPLLAWIVRWLGAGPHARPLGLLATRRDTPHEGAEQIDLVGGQIGLGIRHGQVQVQDAKRGYDRQLDLRGQLVAHGGAQVVLDLFGGL